MTEEQNSSSPSRPEADELCARCGHHKEAHDYSTFMGNEHYGKCPFCDCSGFLAPNDPTERPDCLGTYKCMVKEQCKFSAECREIFQSKGDRRGKAITSIDVGGNAPEIPAAGDAVANANATAIMAGSSAEGGRSPSPATLCARCRENLAVGKSQFCKECIEHEIGMAMDILTGHTALYYTDYIRSRHDFFAESSEWAGHWAYFHMMIDGALHDIKRLHEEVHGAKDERAGEAPAPATFHAGQGAYTDIKSVARYGKPYVPATQQSLGSPRRQEGGEIDAFEAWLHTRCDHKEQNASWSRGYNAAYIECLYEYRRMKKSGEIPSIPQNGSKEGRI